MKFCGSTEKFLKLKHLAGDTYDHQLIDFTCVLEEVIISVHHLHKREMVSRAIGKIKRLFGKIQPGDPNHGYFSKWTDRVIQILCRLHRATGSNNQSEIDDWIAILYSKVRDMILAYPSPHHSF